MLEISAENKKMIYIPEGFAHGFQTLTDNCELIYHHTAFYKPDVESGLRFDDPLLNIEWLLPIGEISNRDLSYKHISKDFKGVKQQL
jgi:dTDP-4-dehydrorhamnose 3,5-epimerase